MSREAKLALITILFTLLNFGHALYSEIAWSTHSQATFALIQSVGFVGMSLSSECTATRNPVLETICACLGDMPGGYCYHLSCAIVGIPVVTEQPNQIEIIHNAD